MLKNIRQRINDFNARRELLRNCVGLQEDSQGLAGEELVSMLYSERWERFFWIKQLRSEIEGLAKVVEKKNPKVVVEVGTNMGGSLFVFTKLAKDDATIISVDLPGGEGGGGYPSYRSPFYKSFVRADQTMDLIRGDSHDQQVYRLVVEKLKGQKIDFLFLDGDHSFKGIKQDFEMYGELVAPGGLVAFHDIKPSDPENWRQVGPFWESIKDDYKYEEILSQEDSWGGIGVLYT